MFKTGIELLIGRPGAGKSFFMVERMLDWILRDKRPVYTNLPLRHRVIKKYLKLKGGEHCEGLIYDLTESRFNTFIEGFGERQKFISEALTAGTSRSEAIKNWEVRNPTFMDWWIPAGSIIAIDEAHHWYPNPALSNVRKREPEALMTFLTMHRHGQYLVLFATQADRQISTTVKSLVATKYEVRRWDQEPIVGDFSLEFIGIPILKYDEYMGEDDPEKTKPLRSFTRFPTMPWYQIYFRLYESFTHSGGKYEAERAVQQKRLEAGLEQKVPKNKYLTKSISWFWKWFTRILIFGVIATVFYRCGSGNSSTSFSSDEDVVLTLKGISKNKAFMADDSEVILNGTHKGATLSFIHPEGYTYWRFKDATYSIKVGQSLRIGAGVFVRDPTFSDENSELD